jgi:hypothetical protein
MTTRAAALPPGLPPRFLSREQAAAYVGVSATLFDSEVRAGLWPQPLVRGASAGRLTWDRCALDAWANAASGLHHALAAPLAAPPQAPDSPLAAAELQALERSGDAPPKNVRPKAGRPQAA